MNNDDREDPAHGARVREREAQLRGALARVPDPIPPDPPKAPSEGKARAALAAARQAARQAFADGYRRLCAEYRCALAWREVWVNGALAGGELVAVDDPAPPAG